MSQSKIKVLVVGDSMIKYLEGMLITKLNICDIEVKSFGGSRVEDLLKKLPYLNLKLFDFILIHVGTNNSIEDLNEISKKFSCLFDTISDINDKIKVLISGVIPWGPNYFSNDLGIEDIFLHNKKINIINSELKRLSLVKGYTFFKRNPRDWSGCLSRDGLHLNYRGSTELANDFVKQLKFSISAEYCLSTVKESKCTKLPEKVEISSEVVLKIIKHCHEEGAGVTDVAQGVLLGLGVDNRLEITNCFPYPRHTDEEDFDEMEYQMEMMRHLRHVNVDHLHVGWYQSTHFGSFYNKPLLESQFNYQSSIEESVVLIYDPVRTTRGFLSLRAYRLSNTAMKLYKEGEFTLDMLKNLHVSYSKMFEEITVIIRNSHLVNLLMCEIADSMPEQESNQFLDMGTASVLEKNLQAMMECVDTVTQETNKLTNHQRQVIKQQQAKNQYLQKRAAENNARIAKGEPPLPEDDINKLFKPIPPPSRLDALLVSGQIDSYCKQISQFSTQNLAKLFMTEALYQK